ncbi:MAG: amidohydrolase family protein [Myxococcota bacterium]|nr:amidohydrolase [Spirochaeta sp.]RPG13775.1 MAG: amidohydrolase [Proteobacteria bacterium TMED72]
MKFASDRRRFLGHLGTGAVAMMGLPMLGCEEEESGRYTEADAARLKEQMRREKELSGTSRFGKHVYPGYRGLAELPYFEIDQNERLRCVVENMPPAIDFHTHLGIAVLLAPPIDLLARTDRVRHFLDCDGTTPGCPLDLDVYINANFREEDLASLDWETVGQGIWGSASAQTHTIPNLLDEMDQTGIEKAVVLPIALGLPFRDEMADQWTQAIEKSGSSERLIPGASVHPTDPNALAELRRQAGLGARVVKLHPAVQRFYPDDPQADPIYEECERLGLPVFFHGGRAGIEPEYTHRFTLIKNYEGAVGQHPEVDFVLGHAGARDVEDAIPFARRHPNVFLDIHGQGIRQIDELIDQVGADRLVFGSDWPFYHPVATLAKVLIVTEGRPEIRDAILSNTARKLLAKTEPVAQVTPRDPRAKNPIREWRPPQPA